MAASVYITMYTNSTCMAYRSQSVNCRTSIIIILIVGSQCEQTYVRRRIVSYSLQIYDPGVGEDG